MKIYYWSPFFTNIATEKAVINSIFSINKYSRNEISTSLIEVIGEWQNQKININQKKINIKKLFKFNLIKFLPKYGFFNSRISYIVVFLFSVFKLHQILKKDKPDFLIIHLMTFIPLSLLSIFNYDTKFILRISGYPKLNFLRTLLWRLVGKKIYLVTSPTNSTLNLLKEKKIFEFNKIRYLPDPIIEIKEIQKKKAEKNIIENKISKNDTLISIGRLTKQKNFRFLLKVFYELQNLYPDLNLCIVGEGEERDKLVEIIKKYNLDKKVFLVGYKNNIYDYLKNSKALILPSLWEDPGFVLVEAGYMNKTIISSDCPNSPRELLENGKNGFLFSSNNIDSFIKTFNEMESSDNETILSKKISYKKKIRDFTIFNHYQILKKLINEEQN
jgi:glycosyltransferase involved in cell wall biosynthesis